MLYLSNYNRRTDEFFISSTDDKGKAYKTATREHVIKAMRAGMKIAGLMISNGNLCVDVKCYSEVLLDNLEVGTPLSYTLNGLVKHAVYAGKEDNKYYFFDEGYAQFAFSNDFLYRNQMKLEFTLGKVEPEKVAGILKRLHGN